MEHTISFDVTADDHKIIVEIVDRALALYDTLGIAVPDGLDLVMDIIAVHVNGCPLDLKALVSAPNSDFAHDIGGIQRHINRLTGKLGDCFVPRMASR